MLTEAIETRARQNFAAVRGRLTRLWRPIDEVPICQWVESQLRFGPGNRGVQLESRTGPLTFDDSPWWRFPLECAAARNCCSLAIPAATQTHKTTSLLLALPLWLAEFRPAPAMIVVPDELEAKKIRDRMYCLVEESQKFSRFLRVRIPPEHKWNLQEINLGSMLIHLAWAGSRQRTRGKPCYYVFFTEVDVYRDADAKAGDPVEAGKQRTKDVFRYKHLFESSPREAPSTVCDEEALADDRWRWYVTCPVCGTKQEARFFRYKQGERAGCGGIDFTLTAKGADEPQLMTPQQARERAEYVCVKGCRIASDQKQELVEGGNWYPLGFKHGSPEPKRVPGSRVGFHLWAIHSPNETFGTIAEDYLIHLRKGRKVDFYGNRLAIAYEAETKIPSWVELGRRAAATHARRTVPASCWFLTAGIDKQGENNGTRYVVRGWAPGRTSWLIDWGWIERDPTADEGLILSDLAQLEGRLLSPDFPVVDEANEPAANPLGKSMLPVRLAAIDTNHLPRQIHRWMRTLPEHWLDRLAGKTLLPGRIRAVRGDHKVSSEVRYRHNLVETNSRTGEKYEGGLHQWGICVYPYYSELTDSISGAPGQLGSWYITADCLAKGREYLEQVTNFHYVIRHDPRRGKKGSWEPRSGRIPIDFWDCEIYAMAAAEMVVGTMGWDESAWRQWQRREQQQRQTRKTGRRRTQSPPEEIGAR